ncbi:hypothetical protein PR048_017995 [Dryococelus australis]|uniref:Uncharacterized protein n=1 Tax=Dryococelus australis TaxID=614101 RepID=A0ABQ9HBM4_9NEOP|nr:hypothetical protein PR048_017995 [Dryococelus australis]
MSAGSAGGVGVVCSVLKSVCRNFVFLSMNAEGSTGKIVLLFTVEGPEEKGNQKLGGTMVGLTVVLAGFRNGIQKPGGTMVGFTGGDGLANADQKLGGTMVGFATGDLAAANDDKETGFSLTTSALSPPSSPRGPPLRNILLSKSSVSSANTSRLAADVALGDGVSSCFSKMLSNAIFLYATMFGSAVVGTSVLTSWAVSGESSSFWWKQSIQESSLLSNEVVGVDDWWKKGWFGGQEGLQRQEWIHGIVRTACLITPLNIKPGRERNCNHSLRKSQVQKSLHRPAIGVKYVKQRADIRQHDAGHVVFPYQAGQQREKIAEKGVRSEMSMEQRRNAKAGKAGYTRENLTNSGVVRHDSYVRKSGSDPAGNRIRWEASSLTTTAPRPKIRGGTGIQGWGKQKITEKTCQPATSSGTIVTCENSEATPPGIEPGSPWWEISRLTTKPPWHPRI